MKNAVFWDITPCGSCKNRRFGELSAPTIRVARIGELGTTLAVTSNRFSSLILVTLTMEALISSETSLLTRATQRNIPENGILHSHRRENLKSYRDFLGFHQQTHIVKSGCRNTFSNDLLKREFHGFIDYITEA
jgi:hypothetical protein